MFNVILIILLTSCVFMPSLIPFVMIFLFFRTLILLVRRLRFGQVIRLFRDASIVVVGVRGSGKDLLMSNVVAYRKKPYCSNMNYCEGKKKQPVQYPFDPLYVRLGFNKYVNFADNCLIPYTYPLPDNCDYYISDAGVYFPSQEFSDLNKRFPEIPMFQALVRHVGDANFHCNVQNLNRLWDKIREQAEYYIRCISCKVTKSGMVKQTIILYDKYQSCVDRVDPFSVKRPLLGKAVKNDHAIAKAKFKAQYGNIQKLKLCYKNKGHYDSRRFKTMLQEGDVNVQTNS